MPPDAGMLSEATRSQCPMVYFREGMALTTYPGGWTYGHLERDHHNHLIAIIALP